MQTTDQVALIDIFVVPEESKEAFLQQTRIAQEVVKTLDGFVEGYVYVKTIGDSRYNVITTAVWKDQEAMRAARQNIAEQYQKIGFNPAHIMQQLGVVIERAQYSRTSY